MDAPVRYARQVEIRIVTDGTAEGTRIWIAGEEKTPRLTEFGIVIRGRRQVSMDFTRVLPDRTTEYVKCYGPESFAKLGAKAENIADGDLIGCRAAKDMNTKEG